MLENPTTMAASSLSPSVGQTSSPTSTLSLGRSVSACVSDGVRVRVRVRVRACACVCVHVGGCGRMSDVCIVCVCV